jgi:hypothetical protein
MMFKHWMTGEQNFGRMYILREDDIKQTIQMDDKISENEHYFTTHSIRFDLSHMQ